MSSLRRAFDVLYWCCIVLAGLALVLISAVIPWAVFTRYVLNSAASWPEPTAVLLTIIVTFIGSAACYRVGTHMNIGFFAKLMPLFVQRLLDLLTQGLVGAFGGFMVIWGARLVEATWHNSIADFPALSTGVTYMPIPIGGAVLVLFVVERLVLGPCPVPASSDHGH